jgi:predicted nucleic acid-binding protein
MRIYVETSVVSYLTARPSRDVIIAGQQALTRAWWDEGAHDFELCFSDVVREEAALGDPQAARDRLAKLDTLTELPISVQATELAEELVAQGALPKKAYVDALHVAVCVTNGVDILVSWNCKHIVNVTMQRVIERVCREAGFEPARICTPVELWGL